MNAIDLDSLNLEELHREALAAGQWHARSEYRLICCLEAVERRGVHREKECGSLVQYAIRYLHLAPHKAAEMLRVGRVLRKMPLVDRAYREGRLCWSKVREITRILNQENEEKVLDFALRHTVPQVESMVACSPAAWKKRRQEAQVGVASEGSRASEGPSKFQDDLFASPAAAPSVDRGRAALPAATGTPPGGSVPECPKTTSGLEAAPVAPAPAGVPAGVPAVAGTSGRSAGTGDASKPTETLAPPAEPPVTPLILYKTHLAPEEYALLEQAENRIRASLGGRASRAAVLAEMARRILSLGDSRSRVRYQVYLHVDGITGEGWLDTDRGRLPAPPELVQEALRLGHVEIRRSAGAPVAAGEGSADLAGPGSTEPPETTGGENPEKSALVPQLPGPQGIAETRSSDWKSEPADHASSAAVDGPGLPVPAAPGEPAPSSPPTPHRGRRQAVPSATLQQLYARAEGRCEDCGRRVPLDSDHLDFYSEHREHDPARMRLRCRACHTLRHEPDFASRPDWARAREVAMQSRQRQPSLPAWTGRGDDYSPSG